MKRFRTVLFWLHLAAGLIAGLSIGIMCFTGTALAFEKQLVAWAERDVRRVTAPGPEAGRLTLNELAARLQPARPGDRTTAITVSRDPADAVAFAFGREHTLYANPSTGEIRSPASTRMHDFLQLMEDWHRALALGGDHRTTGRAINGVGNLAFLFLALSGLWLWWPRRWSWRNVRAVAVINLRLTGRARDFNWHNTIGLWCAPVLIVLTLTALPISYRWAGDLVYQLAGEEPPGRGPRNAAPAGPAAQNRTPSAPQPESAPAPDPDLDRLLLKLPGLTPDWQTVTLRLPAASRAAAPVTLVVRSAGSWPRTATTTLTMNTATGEVLQAEAFAEQSTGRQIRGWMRFLHTGEALGLGGQLVAGLASLGGCFLVFTGFTLAWCRFFSRKTNPVVPNGSP